MIHRWALPYYLIYLLFTYLIGRILLEYELIEPGWGSAIGVGILGPSLFKTQIKLFKPLGGAEGLNADLERVLQGVQQFCFGQIKIDLSHQRIDHKLTVVRLDEPRLLGPVQVLYGDDEFQHQIKGLIDERREADPESVRALLVELIERRNPELLERIGHEGGTGSANDQ